MACRFFTALRSWIRTLNQFDVYYIWKGQLKIGKYQQEVLGLNQEEVQGWPYGKSTSRRVPECKDSKILQEEKEEECNS